MKPVLIVLSLLPCALLALGFPPPRVAPLFAAPVESARDDAYMVIFQEDIPAEALNAHLSFLELSILSSHAMKPEISVEHVWNDEFLKGYSGIFPKHVVEMIRLRPEVKYVEQDKYMTVAKTQKSAPWGLSRISHRAPVASNNHTRYEYVENGGEGVMVYVVDSGIYLEHEEFEGRARWGTTIVKGQPDKDELGHGTHVAGIVASRKYGVAKSANLTAVKVTDANGNGAVSNFVAGAYWAAKDSQRLQREAAAEIRATGTTRFKGVVINMSLSGVHSPSSNTVLNKIVEYGFPVITAAGNDAGDACTKSPGSAERTITVGASTIEDKRMYESNYGSCVDIFAPGDEILSTWIDGPNSSSEHSGTSMAAPHTAGLLAYLISIYPHQTFDPDFGDEPASSLRQSARAFEELLGAHALVHTMLPGWMANVLRSPSSFQREPETLRSDAEILTPDRLKTALRSLATKDKLAENTLNGSPNLLIFNNATDSKGNSWIDNDFWTGLFVQE